MRPFCGRASPGDQRHGGNGTGRPTCAPCEQPTENTPDPSVQIVSAGQSAIRLTIKCQRGVGGNRAAPCRGRPGRPCDHRGDPARTAAPALRSDPRVQAASPHCGSDNATRPQSCRTGSPCDQPYCGRGTGRTAQQELAEPVPRPGQVLDLVGPWCDTRPGGAKAAARTAAPSSCELGPLLALPAQTQDAGWLL